MGLALPFSCAYPSVKQGLRRASSANNLPIRGTPSLSFTLQNSSFGRNLSIATINGDRRIRLSKKGSVCCKKQSDRRTSNLSKSNQEEIISLLRRIQSSISKGESRRVEEKKSHDESSENKPLTKAILDVLEKQRKQTEEDTTVQKEPPKRQVEDLRPQSSFAKRTPIPSASGPSGKLPESNSNKALEDMTEKEETASSIETMKLAELKEVAKNRGIKGYSKLKKIQLLELPRSS